MPRFLNCTRNKNTHISKNYLITSMYIRIYRGSSCNFMTVLYMHFSVNSTTFPFELWRAEFSVIDMSSLGVGWRLHINISGELGWGGVLKNRVVMEVEALFWYPVFYVIKRTEEMISCSLTLSLKQIIYSRMSATFSWKSPNFLSFVIGFQMFSLLCRAY